MREASSLFDLWSWRREEEKEEHLLKGESGERRKRLTLMKVRKGHLFVMNVCPNAATYHHRPLPMVLFTISSNFLQALTRSK